MDRKQAWADILDSAKVCLNSPWIVLGDFNSIRNSAEKFGGNNIENSYSENLSNMCRKANLEDLRFSGNFFSWSNMSSATRRICCKLNRALVNDAWLLQMLFLTNLYSWITAFVLSLVGKLRYLRKLPLSFLNFWANHEGFLPMIEEVWMTDIVGCFMFRLLSKLKKLKVELRNLNKREFWNISERVKEARVELSCTQVLLNRDRSNDALRTMEKDQIGKLIFLSKAAESLAKQKSRVNWLKNGDNNSKCFF